MPSEQRAGGGGGGDGGDGGGDGDGGSHSGGGEFGGRIQCKRHAGMPGGGGGGGGGLGCMRPSRRPSQADGSSARWAWSWCSISLARKFWRRRAL